MSGELDALVEKWGEENVRKAFWLQSKIKQEGIDGIYFMHDEGKGLSAESRMKQTGPIIAQSIIESELDDSY